MIVLLSYIKHSEDPTDMLEMDNAVFVCNRSIDGAKTCGAAATRLGVAAAPDAFIN